MHRSASVLCLLSLISASVYYANAQLQYGRAPSEHYEYFVFNKSNSTEAPKDGTLFARLPSNILLKYTSYKDVSILHFQVPPDTRTAFFTFKAFEESKSAFQRRCKPRDVTVHLKASSYPVISPENITFPKTFLSADQRFKIYDLQFKSDEVQQSINVLSPQMGNWYAIAFVSWTDPSNERIEQQGLTASCETLLLAEMTVRRFRPIILNDGETHFDKLTSPGRALPVTATTTKTTTTTTMAPQQDGLAAATEQHGWNDTPTESQYKSKSENLPQQEVEAEQAEPLHHKVEFAVAAGQQSMAAADADSNVEPFASNETIKAKEAAAARSSAQSSPNMHNSNRTAEAKSKNRSSIRRARPHFGLAEDNTFKFYVPAKVGVASACLTFSEVCTECPDVSIHVQANAYPSMECNHDDSNCIHSTIIRPNHTEEIRIEFYVQPSTWHYALVEFANPALIEAAEAQNGPTPTADKWNAIDGLRGWLTQQRNSNSRGPESARLKTNTTAEQRVEYSFRIDFLDETDDTDEEENAQNSADSANAENSTDQQQNPWRPERFRNMEFYPLLRQSYREFFMFDYDLVPDANGTVPAVLNLTAGMPAGFAFELGDVYDIGGTLTFAVSMKHGVGDSSDLKPTASSSSGLERGGLLAEKLIERHEGSLKQSADGERALARSNQTIIVCMHLGEPGVPTWPDKCRYGRHLMAASSIVNNTDSSTSTGLVHVPFPESGNWYVTMGLYCHGAETAARETIIDSVKEFVKAYEPMLHSMKKPCACAAKASDYADCIANGPCLAALNETETLKIKECMMDSRCTPNYMDMTRRFEAHHKLAIEQHFALDNCNTSVVFTVSSNPCVAGRCGRFGRCYHYMSGGFVFSTCVCMKGYRGWDCTEDSQVPSNMSILLGSLLLTLSNLLFIPSIIMALRRLYHTEAVIYSFAMVFSIFYHACDSGEDEYSFCLAKISVLQFCDFYCGLLAIWVTLIAMSQLRPLFVSLLHMLGAILLAFGTELDKQSLWVFLAPALTGICIISASWGMRCYKTRKWYPARNYLIIYMPIGAALAMVGLVCFAFLQTKQNYHIVHSIWHILMALSILCLLPSRKYFNPKC